MCALVPFQKQVRDLAEICLNSNDNMQIYLYGLPLLVYSDKTLGIVAISVINS